jgi:hypothetical protein
MKRLTTLYQKLLGIPSIWEAENVDLTHLDGFIIDQHVPNSKLSGCGLSRTFTFLSGNSHLIFAQCANYPTTDLAMLTPV